MLCFLSRHSYSHLLTPATLIFLRYEKMDTVTVISNLASNALTSLGSSPLKAAAAALDFKSDLDKLTDTIIIIKDVLVARESQPQHPIIGHLIERLKDPVHEADDLLDEFTTLLEREKLTRNPDRLTEELRVFFSRENQLATAFRMAEEIKRIRETLDDIVRDHHQFASMLPARDPGEQSALVKREETCSFIVDDDVIGRDDDKGYILDELLNTRMDLIIFPIIGMGGLGKTAIAQLVFNAEDVKRHFEPKIWACIGNDDLDLKFIIRKIIMAVNSSCPNDVSLEYLLSELRKMVGGKKYLLVLDDLWGENLRILSKLQNYLKIGGKGSAVLVTTRSKDTAEGIGTVNPLDLQLLSDDASWILFEKMTSTSGEQHEKVLIGKAIVKKCANLPLAIRVIGMMLRNRNKEEWKAFKDHDLAKIDIANDGDIIPLLKLSYYRLSPELKHCFAYCSLFPKDYVMNKIKLFQLWIAQGFIPSSPLPDKSLEDVAKECFNRLLNRCFFQDIYRNRWGEIESFKMHDLIHDLAKEVAGKEFLLVDGSGNYDDSSIKGKGHLSFTDLSLLPDLCSSLRGGNHIRTFLRPSPGVWGNNRIPNGWEASNLISSFRCIKVLDLGDQKLDKLPDSISQLIHIRYLDLSGNNFEMLPESITGLHNLQTLNLSWCFNLKELPCDLNKLVNLQNLDLTYCESLEYMPSGMGSLTCLQRLTTFVVGENKSARTTNHASGFGDLFLLNNLRGSLEIYINRKGTTSDSMPITTKASCLLDKGGLTSLEISFNSWVRPVDDSQDEELLESLQPHSNLKCFQLRGRYGGQKFPSWMSMNNLALVLPNLVEIQLFNCTSCQNIPILSLLPSLKKVVLWGLGCLMYIEDTSQEPSTSSKSVAFFPSLRYLVLRCLPYVRGWWGPTAVLPPPSFPRLESLWVENCPNMTSMPLCPGVEELFLKKFNENLHIILENEDSAAASLLPSSSSTILSSSAAPNSCSSTPQLESLRIDNTYYNHLPKQYLQSLTHLTIAECTHEALSKSFLQHFTAIVELRIYNCPALDFSAAHNEEDDQLQWKCLKQLRYLVFDVLPKLTTLPKGLEYLTNLQQLRINCCCKLAELPEWIGQLSSLQSLEIVECPGLKSLPDGIQGLTSLRRIYIKYCHSLSRRCREPTDEDRPKIQHVPEICVEDWDD